MTDLKEMIRDAGKMAAPAVQGEPVAWMVTCIRTDFDKPIKALHSAQLLADEQQRHWEGRGCLVYQTPLYTTPQPARQQSAPDVSALVEALELARDRIESERRSGEWDPLLRDIDSALAAYQQGGGE